MFTNNKSLKVTVFILLLVVVAIFSGCGGTAPPVNHSPIISGITVNPYSVDINQSTVITCIATDPDGDILTYTWTKTGGIITASGLTIIWTAPATAGNFTITCTVFDGKGGEDSESVDISVSEINHSPVISGLTANPSSIDINQGSTITCIAYDPDGDNLTYNWTKTGGIISGSGSAII